MDKERPSRRSPLRSPIARIVLGMALGIAAGVALGPRAEGIGELAKAIVNLIKALATPLLLFAILDAFLRTRVRARSGAIMAAISLTNAAIAVAIGLTLSNVIRPGRSLSVALTPQGPGETAPGVRPIRPVGDVLDWVPTNLIEPFRTNAIVSIVILAVLGGLALRRFKDEQVAAGEGGYRAVEGFVSGVYRALELLLGWVVALVPLAVFASVARAVGTQGFAAFRGLAVYLGVGILGLALHVGVVYQAWIVLVARMPLRRFWRGLGEPLACAAGSSSSLATLPVTLLSLRRMGVSDASARMAACVGTNLNNDGIILYEAMAALFVAQAYGIDLSIGRQLMVAGASVLAGVGIAGVPEAGLISLALVLTTVGLPLEVLPLLLSVDWILARCRATTNVVSDALVAVLLDRLDPDRAAPGREPASGVSSPSRAAILAGASGATAP